MSLSIVQIDTSTGHRYLTQGINNEFPSITASDVCCKQLMNDEFISSVATPFAFTTYRNEQYLKANNCYFYTLSIVGNINADAENNSEDRDMNSDPLRLQIYKIDGSNNYLQIDEVLINAVDHTFNIDYKRLLVVENDYKICYRLNYGEIPFYASNNHNLFHLTTTIYRCPKTAYNETFQIVQTPQVNQLYHIVEFDNIPFDGYYRINAYVEVQELNNLGNAVNLAYPQVLMVYDDDISNYKTVTNSHAFTPSSIEDLNILWNPSLDGSVITKISNTSFATRKLRLRVSLPNGVQKRVMEGYAQVQFLGALKYANDKILI